MTTRDVLAGSVGGLVVLAGFGAHQQWVSRDPLLPPPILRVRTVASANAGMFVIGLGFFASPVLLSLYLQTVQRLGPFAAGVAFVPGALGLMVGGRLAGRATVAVGARRAGITGLLLATVGFAALACLLTSPHPVMPALEARWRCSGWGSAPSFTPITVHIRATSPIRRPGVGRVHGRLRAGRGVRRRGRGPGRTRTAPRPLRTR